MADIHDFLLAERESAEALQSAEALAGRVEDADLGVAGTVALAVLIGSVAIARAVKCAEVRADYVARDQAKRAEHRY